jgi:methyl-accepting chemotaxis protein
MTPYSAFAIALAVAMLANAVALGALYRRTRRPLWALFSGGCAVAVFYCLLNKHQPAIHEAPPPVAVFFGLALEWVLLAGAALHMELGPKPQRRILITLGTMVMGIVLWTLVQPLSRLDLHRLYGVLHLTTIASALLTLRGAGLKRAVPTLAVLSLLPVVVSFPTQLGIDISYLRYLTLAGGALLTLTLVVDALLEEHRKAGEAIERMAETQQVLRALVHSMAEGATQVAGAGQNVSRTAQELAVHTDVQQDSLGDVAQTIERFADQVEATAQSVGVVDQRCNSLRDTAHQSTERVTHATEVIQKIEARTQDMAQALGRIESIAFQTNVLAINASIEAARAGEAGRGFAVVASEVRALATETTGTAQSVRELIQRASEQVELGVSSVRGVASGINEMLGAVDDVATRAREVAAQAVAQTAALADARDRLGRLSELTRTNAEMVGQSVLAADGMSGSADRLQAMVEQLQREHPSARDALAVTRELAQAMAASRETVDYF